MKYALVYIVLLVASLSGQVHTAPVETDHCPALLRNESNLDMVFDLSDLVFIARISPRSGPNPKIYNFQLLDPQLKGNVPKQGHITFAGECSPVDDNAIYLFFLNSLDEKIANANAIFFSLTPEGPGFTWIAEWIRDKLGSYDPFEVED